MQCGFRANRCTTNVVFVLRQLQEKCQEQKKKKEVNVTLVDLTKALDTGAKKKALDTGAKKKKH